MICTHGVFPFNVICVKINNYFQKNHAGRDNCSVVQAFIGGDNGKYLHRANQNALVARLVVTFPTNNFYLGCVLSNHR